jgi:hypothetical protein
MMIDVRELDDVGDTQTSSRSPKYVPPHRESSLTYRETFMSHTSPLAARALRADSTLRVIMS